MGILKAQEIELENFGRKSAASNQLYRKTEEAKQYQSMYKDAMIQLALLKKRHAELSERFSDLEKNYNDKLTDVQKILRANETASKTISHISQQFSLVEKQLHQLYEDALRAMSSLQKYEEQVQDEGLQRQVAVLKANYEKLIRFYNQVGQLW